MKRHRFRRPRRPGGPVIILIAGLLLAGLIAVSYAERPAPPLEEVNAAHHAIQHAEKGPAATYYPEKIREAETLLDTSRSAMNAETRRLYFLRNYTPARLSAERAARLAAACDSAGIALHDSLHVAADAAIERARSALVDLDQSLASMPRESQYEMRVARFQMAVAGSANLMKQEAYRESIRLASGVIDDATRLSGVVHERYVGWTASRGKWREMARQTIQWSRANGAPAIIVRKLDHTCDLYVSGELIESFHAELGAHWMGAKLHRGDGVTPEGTYRIMRKKGPSETQFYKALLLNYPNDKRDGRLPQGVGIGSLIEIHGNGGRGEDWTSGCVALENHDMDRLFGRVNVGTPVTIIGSDGNL